ncbi:MAG: hypothetical protein IPI17_08280 [Nitrosomonas sp.]|nr:hypothetical protein [Nitrosomonas sp.]
MEKTIWVYGARKVRGGSCCEKVLVLARCTIERLMKKLGNTRCPTRQKCWNHFGRFA